eukprot:782841_1
MLIPYYFTLLLYLTTCTMAQPCCIFSKPIDTQSQLKILEPINTCRDDGPRYTNSSLVFGIWCGHSDDAYSQSMLSFKWINFILFGFNIDETVRCVQFNPMSTQLTSTYVLMITVGSDVIGLETRTGDYVVIFCQSISSLEWIDSILFRLNIDETVRCVQLNPMSTQLTSTYVLMIAVGSNVIGLETRTSYYLVVLSQLIIDLKVINVSYFLVYICT